MAPKKDTMMLDPESHELPEEEPPEQETIHDVKQSKSRFMFRTTCALPQPDETTQSAGGLSLVDLADEHVRLGRLGPCGHEVLHGPSGHEELQTCRQPEKPNSSPIIRQAKSVAFKEVDSFYGESSLSQSLESGSNPGWGLKIEFPGRLSDDLRRPGQDDDNEDTATRTETRTTSSPTNHSRAAWSALTGDGGTISTGSYWIEGETRKVMFALSALLIFLIICSLTLAGLCGAGFCQRRVSAVSTEPSAGNVSGLLLVTTQQLYSAVDLYLRDPEAFDPISTWDVSAVKDFSSVFDSSRNADASRFQVSDLAGWDTSRATNMDRMFRGAKAFNGDISAFQTSQVTSMESMFEDAQSFDGYLGTWSLSSVINTKAMFLNAFSFRGAGLEFWDTRNVIDMSRMFQHTSSFNGDLSRWRVENVRTMKEMFRHAKIFNAVISSWNTALVEDMSAMFLGARRFQSSVSTWDISRCTSMARMFAAATEFRDDLCGWHQRLETGEVDFTSMFLVSGCSVTDDPVLTGVQRETFLCESCGVVDVPAPPIEAFPVELTPAPIPNKAELLRAVDSYLIDGRESTVVLAYGWPMGIWDVSKIEDFAAVFDADRNELVKLFDEDLSRWNVTSAVTMERMFAGASSFDGNISPWSTGNVRSMREMFKGATSFQSDLSSWDTARCVDMTSMFEEADRFNGEVSNFQTSSVTNMSFMFRGAFSFVGRGLASWDTSQCTNMGGMFEEAVSLQGDLSAWEVSSSITMERMFRFANSWNNDISDWDVSNVASFAFMFNGASAFNRDLSRWNVRASNFDGMFAGAISFNRNSCSWGEKIALVDAVTTESMFVSSACHVEDDPNVAEFGPYCTGCSVGAL